MLHDGNVDLPTKAANGCCAFFGLCFPRAPYFQALPGQEEITNGFNIPEDYFSFIASDAMQDRIEYRWEQLRTGSR